MDQIVIGIVMWKRSKFECKVIAIRRIFAQSKRCECAAIKIGGCIELCVVKCLRHFSTDSH